jgi:tetratricopeptide (TPR) repeat protein
VSPRSRDYNEREHAGIFYAQSWALVPMLNLAPEYRESLPKFLELLLDSRPAAEAFQTAFGRTLDKALADLSGYVNRMRSTTVGFARGEAAAPPVVSRVAPVTALLLRADLALHVDRASIARGLFQKAARDFSDSPEAIAGLGTLAMSEGRWEDARRHLERAIQSLPAGADLLFEYAMLERDTGASQARVDELLRRVIAADAQHGEAQFLLGSHASDDGRWEEAARHLEQAARVLPRRSFVWHALGLAQWKLGRAREAGVSAHRASATAATDAEEQMASTLAELVRGDAK